MRSRRLTVKALHLLSVLGFIAAAAAVFLRFSYKNTVILTALLIVGFDYLASHDALLKAKRVLTERCDPAAYLSLYLAWMEQQPRVANGVHYYNVGRALYYDGDFDAAERLLTLFKENLRNNKDYFYYELLAVLLAFQAEDGEQVNRHLGILAALREKVDTAGEQETLYRQASQFPIMLDALQKGAYKMGFEAFDDVKTMQDNYKEPLRIAERSYFLYLMARGMGDDYLTHKYGKLVLQLGNKLWFAEEIELPAEEETAEEQDDADSPDLDSADRRNPQAEARTAAEKEAPPEEDANDVRGD